MAYDGKIMRRAMARFEDDKHTREDRFAQRREGIFRRCPRLQAIDAELTGTMSRIITQALRHGSDPRAAVERLREENLSLQAERKALLYDLGLPEDALEEKPACPLCGDTGYRGGAVCRCLREYYAREQQKELSRMLDLGGQSFETFSLQWYSDQDSMGLGISPRENMDWVYRSCKRYAEEFKPGKSGNLLLTGDPGLGKTFLMNCVAQRVLERGYSVVVISAYKLIEAMRRFQFGEDSVDQVQDLLSCDLLCIDDLGSEPMYQKITVETLFSLINDRMSRQQPMAFSTNLTPMELNDRYGSRLASRLLDRKSVHVLRLEGEDVRLTKK
jgi:DNA replication protein DnaC